MSVTTLKGEDLKKRGLNEAKSIVQTLVKENPAKKLLDQLKTPYTVLELDALEGNKEDAIQDELQKVTGARTVPRIFVGGRSIGGYDDTSRLHRNGGLIPRIQEAGVTVGQAL